MHSETRNEGDRVIETKYTVGPGLRMAIIFLSFLITVSIGFASGWFMCQNSVKGADKANQVEVLKSDTKEGLQLVKDYLIADEIIRDKREGRDYDKECGDMLIRDVIGK